LEAEIAANAGHERDHQIAGTAGHTVVAIALARDMAAGR
jgi:hypothetical protein